MAPRMAPTDMGMVPAMVLTLDTTVKRQLPSLRAVPMASILLPAVVPPTVIGEYLFFENNLLCYEFYSLWYSPTSFLLLNVFPKLSKFYWPFDTVVKLR